MHDVAQLFDEFAQLRARGERPDVSVFLDRAGSASDTLARMIDGLLAASPPPPPSADLVAVFRAVAMNESICLALRHAHGLSEDEIVTVLAQHLGIAPSGISYFAAKYGLLERGFIELRDISERLVDALRSLLGSGIDAGLQVTAPVGAVRGGEDASPAIHLSAGDALDQLDRALRMQIDELFWHGEA
jgi:hypothetical protein